VKKLAAVAVLGAAALAARHYFAMRDAMVAVAVDLRSPIVPFTSVSFNKRTLPVIRLLFSLRTRSGPGVSVAERYVGDPAVRVLVTTPVERDAAAPALLWIHGGGMIVGTPQFEAMGSGRAARELGAVVVSPDYRLAPEHRFPAGLDDCMVTLRWMRSHAEELGIDPDRIAVVGASAGGGLCAAVAQRSYDERIPLRAQGLVYPMLDDRTVLLDTCVESVRVDGVSGARAADVGRAGVRSAGSAHRPDWSATGVGRRRRARSVLRRERGLRRKTEGVRRSV
jgi:acetyl esterase/lipase